MFDHASINRAYKLVWSDRLRAYVPAPENARGRGQRAVRSIAVSVVMALSASVHAQTALPPVSTQLPTNGAVVAGQANIAQSGARMDITQSTHRAAIDWQTFNVGNRAQVNFNQPSTQSVILNRVLDAQPSQIYGRITSNGQVFLSNPNGVYFSPGASVDVGGLVATTHGISNADFMAGKSTFERNGSTAAVVNQGQLNAALGGYIALLAPEVRNEGVVVAQAGTVAMASGESITLKFGGANNLTGISVTPSQIKALVDNQHAVFAPGGLVILSAQAADRLRGGVVNNSGVIEAQGIVNRAGRIMLEASDRVENRGVARADSGAAASAGQISVNARDIVNSGTLSAAQSESVAAPAQPANGGDIALRASRSLTQTASGRIDVSADQGGSVVLKADYDIGLQGAVAAASNSGAGGRIQIQAWHSEPSLPVAPTTPSTVMLANAELRAGSSRARGGTVTLEGDTLHLANHTLIDARGASGGGTVLVGGDWQGSGTLRQATQVIMAGGTTIDASATREGDGGKVVLWSDVRHRRGETVFNGRIDAFGAGAGKGGQVETSGHRLSVRGTVNTGKGGQWLIDPYDVVIDNAASSNSDGAFNATGAPAVVDANAIVAALTAGSDVTVTTGNAGPDQGHIILNSNLHTGAMANDATLTLKAERNVVFNNGYSIDATQNGNTRKLNVVLWANAAGTGGGIDMGSNTAIRSNGGSIVLGGGTDIATGYAVGASSYEGGRGIWLHDGTVLNAAGGNITLRGRGKDGGEGIVLGDPGADPMNPGNSLLMTHGSGTIHLNGVGTTAVPGAHTAGIKLFNEVRLQTQHGALQITGSGGDSLSADVDNSGIVFGPGSRVLSASGPISLNGTVGTGPSTAGTGIRFESGTNFLGHDGGTHLAASNSPITLSADAWRSDGATTNINTAGALTLQPASVSFTNTLDWSGAVSNDNFVGAGSMNGFVINNLRGLGALTLGKAGNSADIAISSDLRVDGPITIIGQNIQLNQEVRVDNQTLTVNASGSVTQSERLRVARLLLNGAGDYTLDHHDNRIGTLAADVGSGSLVLKNDRPLAIGSVQGVNGVTSYNTVHIETSAGQTLTVNQPVTSPSPTLIAGGDLVLNAAVAATMSDMLLVAGGAFVNNAGANALGAAGRWLVYSASPSANTFGGLVSGNIGLFGRQFSNYGPADVATDGHSGHRFLFSDTQNIAVTTLNASNVYGAPPVALANHYSVAAINTYGGAILAPTLSGAPVITSAGASSSANAGAYTVNADVSGMSINASGYNLVANNQGILTIAPRPVNLSGSRVYDATTAINANSITLGNLFNGDAVSLSGVGILSSKDVGTRGLAGAGTLALSNANYTLSGATTAFSITPASVSVSGVTAQHRIYDATTAATLAGTPTVAGLGTDSLSVGGNAIASFSDKNVGTNKAVSVGGYVLQGADASNYVLQQPTGLSTNITPATLTVSGITAQNKIYDATAAGTLTGIANVAALGADVVTLSGSAVATFSDKNVGIAKPVTVAGYGLQGADAGNYILRQPTGLTANITPATLTVSGITAQNKIYDATTAATLTGTASVAALGADVVTLSGSAVATFSDKNVGIAKPVTVAGYGLQGADVGNYILRQPTGLTANITPATLAVSGVSAQNKVYDATTTATLAGTASVTALGADAVSIGGAPVARFSDANVGDHKAVSVSGYALHGADAANYVLQQPVSLTAHITAPSPVAVTPSTPRIAPLLPPLPVTDTPRKEIVWPAPARRPLLDVSGAFDVPGTTSLAHAPLTPFVGEVQVVIAEAQAHGGNEYEFRLPPEVRALLDRAGLQRVAVTRIDRSPLPQWLRFDPWGKRLLAHAVPAGALPMSVLITLGTQNTVVKIDLPASLRSVVAAAGE